MSYLIRLTENRPDVEIQKGIAAAIKHATDMWAPLQYEGEYPSKGFGITTLRPRDVYTASTMLGSAYWTISIAAASTWQDWIDVALTDMAYVIVTGIFNIDPAPKTVEIRGKCAGNDLPVVNIEEMYAWDLARAWFTKPFWAKPSDGITIRAMGKAATTVGERLGLLGYTVGKRAYLIKE